MRSRSLLTTSIMTLTLLLTTLACNAAEITCPGAITETPTVSIENKLWSVVTSSGERQFEHAGVYLGPLSAYSAQAPDQTKKTNTKELVTWNIKRSAGDTFWVGCSYVGTTAMLFQKLNEAVAVCVVSYDLLPSGNRLRVSSAQCS